MTLNARVTASSDLSGKHTLRPLGDGMTRWDIEWPRHYSNERYYSRHKLMSIHIDTVDDASFENNYFMDSIPFAFPSQASYEALQNAIRDALSDSKIEVEEQPMQSANLHEAVDGNCCTGCSGKGFKWLGPVSVPGSIRKVELCRECGGYGFYRKTHHVSIILAAFAVVVALFAFTIIPLYRIYFP